jgi:hypothetical protein
METKIPLMVKDWEGKPHIKHFVEEILKVAKEIDEKVEQVVLIKR